MTDNDHNSLHGAPVAGGAQCDFHADSLAPARDLNAKTQSAKRAAPSAHPHFESVDIDQIHYHRYLAEARRRAGVTISLTEPKTGLLTEGKIRKLGYKGPIHVIKERGDYLCFGGVMTLEEARNTLSKSRIFPVLVYASISHEDVLDQVLLDELCTLIHGCSRIKPLKKLIGMVVRIANGFPGIFTKHTKFEWAGYFRRSERSFTMKEEGNETR